MRKYSIVNFDKCNPLFCLKEFGHCKAIDSCLKKLIEQENTDEPPIIFSLKSCSGCGKCIIACPLEAIKINK